MRFKNNLCTKRDYWVKGRKKREFRKSEEFKYEIGLLKDKLIKLERIDKDHANNLENLSKLYDAKIINENGEYIGNSFMYSNWSFK